MTKKRWPELDTLRAVPPSFGGTEAIKVNGIHWGIFPGSRTAEMGNNLFVLDPEGDVHVLTTRQNRVVEIIAAPQVMRRLTMLAKQELFKP